MTADSPLGVSGSTLAPLAQLESLRLTPSPSPLGVSAGPPLLEPGSHRSTPDMEDSLSFPDEDEEEEEEDEDRSGAVTGSAGSSRVNSDERLLSECSTSGSSPAGESGAMVDETEDPLSLPSSVTMAQKSYDYLLKVLLVGDSDVGKPEILAGLPDGPTEWNQFCSSEGAGKSVSRLFNKYGTRLSRILR